MTQWRELLNGKKFADAESEMLADTEAVDQFGENTVSRAAFYECWGDLLSLDFSPDAKEKYAKALGCWQLFASWATSGGEGTARMSDVDRVLTKIEALRGY
jgi:hypothetical protein